MDSQYHRRYFFVDPRVSGRYRGNLPQPDSANKSGAADQLQPSTEQSSRRGLLAAIPASATRSHKDSAIHGSRPRTTWTVVGRRRRAVESNTGALERQRSSSWKEVGTSYS